MEPLLLLAGFVVPPVCPHFPQRHLHTYIIHTEGQKHISSPAGSPAKILEGERERGGNPERDRIKKRRATRDLSGQRRQAPVRRRRGYCRQEYHVPVFVWLLGTRLAIDRVCRLHPPPAEFSLHDNLLTTVNKTSQRQQVARRRSTSLLKKGVCRVVSCLCFCVTPAGSIAARTTRRRRPHSQTLLASTVSATTLAASDGRA